MDDIISENIINDLSSKCERYRESAKASINRFKILLEVNNDLIKESDKYKEEIKQIKNDYEILEDTNNNLKNEIYFLQIRIKNLKNAISNQMVCNGRLKSKAENLIFENKNLKQINDDLNNYYQYNSRPSTHDRSRNSTYQANYYQQYNNYVQYPEQYQMYYLIEYPINNREYSVENLTICEN